MILGKDENIRCKYRNTITSSGIQDKAFGSDMHNGRGACDTDPIREYEIQEVFKKEDDKSANTPTMSIDDIEFHRYSNGGQQPLKRERYDFEKAKEVEKQFAEDPMTSYISSLEYRTLVACVDQNLRKYSSEECEKTQKKKLVDPCSRNSSEVVSMHSSTERNKIFEDLVPSYEERPGRGLKGGDIKPVGPFTEPLNPGKQMKFGKPYDVHNRVNEDFYKDF